MLIFYTLWCKVLYFYVRSIFYEDNYKRVIVLIFDINCTNVGFYVFYKTRMDYRRTGIRRCLYNILEGICGMQDICSYNKNKIW